MSKLCKSNVGHSFEVIKEKIKIEYVVTDESFAHEFGTENQFSYEIMSIEYYIDEISEYVELGESDDLNKYADKIVEGDL